MPIFTLDKMIPGESGKIVRIHGKGPIRRRLVDMGLTHGAVIDMVKTSPLGDPVEYRLRDYHLSLRKSEAQMIEVELLHGSQPQSQRGSETRSVVPLVRCNPGQEVKIIQIRGGRGLQRRFERMDLEPGAIIQVVQNDFPGPMIIALDDDRLVLGKGQARHLLVRPC
jgi:Fe2+ transport system protein FeoA